MKELKDKIKDLQMELIHCRNELCVKCGKYKEAHDGACNGCRYGDGGEWEAYVYE
jgi:hypothetical protein